MIHYQTNGFKGGAFWEAKQKIKDSLPNQWFSRGGSILGSKATNQRFNSKSMVFKGGAFWEAKQKIKDPLPNQRFSGGANFGKQRKKSKIHFQINGFEEGTNYQEK